MQHPASQEVRSMPDNVSALQLILTADPALMAIVRLSLLVSLLAVFFGALIGVPVGAAVALTKFRGREAIIVILNALMGLPPVVVGLLWSSCSSRARARSDHGASCSRRRR